LNGKKIIKSSQPGAQHNERRYMKTQTKHYLSELVGKTIFGVRPLFDSELELMMWDKTSDPTAILEFTDGTYGIVMCDPEGNGSGFIEIGKY